MAELRFLLPLGNNTGLAIASGLVLLAGLSILRAEAQWLTDGLRAPLLHAAGTR